MNLAVLILLMGLVGQLLANGPNLSHLPERKWAPNSIYENDNGNFKIQFQPVDEESLRSNYFRQQLIQSQLETQRAQNDAKEVVLPPTFKLNRANYTDPFWHHWSNPDSKACRAKFAHWPKDKIFHQMQAYRYAGFRQYVESLPGFSDFLLTMGPELRRRAEDGCISRQLFLADGDHGNQILSYLCNKHNYYLERREAQQLRAQGFSDQATQLLREQKVVAQFDYERFGHQQVWQYQQIREHLNDLASFRQVENDSDVVQALTQDSLDYTLLANKANRENLTNASELLLTIAKNILALGKGLVVGGVRNLAALVDPRTYKSGFDLIGQVGLSIADAAEHLLEASLATVTHNQEVVLELQNRQDEVVQNKLGTFCTGLKQSLQHANWEERSEIVGGVVADGLFVVYGGKINMALFRTGGKIVAPFAKYKSMTFAKLGTVGKEIHQIAGLALTKGRDYVQTGLEVLKSYPELAKIQQPLAATIRHCTKKIKTVNNYFQNKLQKRFYRQLQAAGAEGSILHLPPEKQLFLLNDGEIIKPKSGLIKPNGKPFSSAGISLVHPGETAGRILTEEEIFAQSISGKTRENRIFFDHFGNKLVDEVACKEICRSILDNSIFDKNKYPACIQHYAQQISEVEKYLEGMTLWDFFNYAPQVPEHMRYLPVRVDYLHLIHPVPEIKFIDGKFIAKSFKGFHLDHGGVLEKAGEITHEIIRYGPEGSFESKIWLKGFAKPEPKSMFCPDWLPLDVIKASREASARFSELTVNPDFSMFVKGLSENNLPIDTAFSSNGLLTTTYIDFKRVK